MPQSLRADLKILSGLMSAARRRRLIFVGLLMPATALAETASVVAIVPFLALLAGTENGSGLPLVSLLLKDLGTWAPANPLLAAALLFALAVVATTVLRLALSWISQRFAFGLGHDLDVAIQRRLLHQPYLFHLQRHSSELLAMLDKVDFLVFSTALQGIQAASAALIGVLVVAVLLWIDPLSAALAALLVGGLYGLALVTARRRLSVHAQEIGEAFGARVKAAQDSIGGIRDIILDRSQERSLEHFRKIDARFMTARADAAFLVAAPRFLVEALGLILIALLAVTIAGRPGGIVAALPILGALALGAQRLLPMMSQLYTGWANLAASRPVIHELAELASLPIDDVEDTVDALPLTEAIRLDAVSFAYPGRAGPALHDVSLTIAKGTRVAITGKTGSGKSTLADLVMGLIEPSQGKITVDGQELAGLRLARWQKSIAHVPQAIFLTDDGIAANIALSLPGGQIDMDRVRQAAETARLTEFIETLPDGFETRVGERGARLSGGQRQRLALARAIYKDAPALVLDEATNALDYETEVAVLQTLDALRAQGKTIIIVAHRQSMIQGCDVILRLDDEGRLAECSGARRPGPSAAFAP